MYDNFYQLLYLLYNNILNFFKKCILYLSHYCACVCSVSQLCLAFFNTMNCSMPGRPVAHHPWILSKFMFIALVIPPTISFSEPLFSLSPQSFPTSETFPMSQLFASNDKNARASASASVLQKSIQSSFPLKLSVLISFLSKGLSGVFSSSV